MFARSTVSVDRPFIGRSTAVLFGLMVALIASLAISATAARAADEAQVAEQASETVQSATATAEPTTEPSVEQESAPLADEPAEPAPASVETEAPAPEVSPEPTEVEAPAEESPIATPVPAETEDPAETEATEPSEPAPTDPAPVQTPSASATAENQSQTWQAIFQVQQGCQSHCQGTSQSQTAAQVAETIQSATAIGGGTGSPSNATALNQSTTGQFIWQVQLGCVAFCYGTSQSQTAGQWAQTTQNATALSEGNAQAHNVGSVMQEVWQLQFGCQTECYGNSQTQSSTQGQSTSQSATATSETWAHSYPTDAQSLLPAWLVALAENLGVTIQTSWQYQEAGCLEHCTGDSQSQEAAQSASTTQEARAVAGVPPEEPTSPVTQTPPAVEPAPADPVVASTAGAASSQTLFERVTATWRRASRHSSVGSRLRRRASASAASSGPSASTFTRAHIESSTSVETGSSQGKASFSSSSSSKASASSRTSTSSASTDLASVKAEPLRGLGETDWGYGLIGWLLIGLLMAFGVANLRKGHRGRPAI